MLSFINFLDIFKVLFCINFNNRLKNTDLLCVLPYMTPQIQTLLTFSISELKS